MAHRLHPGCAVVVVAPAPFGEMLPAAAVPALRAAAVVYADPAVPAPVASSCGAEPLPAPAELMVRAQAQPVVVLATGGHPVLAGAPVIGSASPPGSGLLAAVTVMDRLRSPGGCPWDAEQTHTSLLQYLVEECYELYQAIEDGDRDAT